MYKCNIILIKWQWWLCYYNNNNNNSNNNTVALQTVGLEHCGRV